MGTQQTQTNTPIKHKQTIFEEEKKQKSKPLPPPVGQTGKTQRGLHLRRTLMGTQQTTNKKTKTNKLTNKSTNNQTIFETNQNKSIQSVILQDVHFTYRTAWCFPQNIYVPVETTVYSPFVYLSRCSICRGAKGLVTSKTGNC